MTISLMRMRTMAMRLPGLVRGFAAGIALSLMLAFTPCCEVSAAAPAAPESAASRHAPDPGGVLHSHETDGHKDICGKWLDNASPAAISYGAFTSSWDGKVAAPVVAERHSFASPDPDAARWRPLHSQSPPHALYLRFTRLLL